MPLVEGMVFEENEFNDFTLRLENYISKIITATMSLGGRKITNIIYEPNKYDLYFKGKFLEQYNNLHEILGVISFKTNGYGYNKSKYYCIRKPDGTWYKKERVTF